ncbi:MAG: hypothetical protein ACXWNX_10435 [Isosphaeraceae bacterium]
MQRARFAGTNPINSSHRDLSRRYPMRLLFSSIHCYLDPSSGAALCTGELLELLAARDGLPGAHGRDSSTPSGKHPLTTC